MYELINENNDTKMLALIICTFNYGNKPYCLYSIERDAEETNIFISKFVKNSLGYALDSNFTPDEKEAIENIITSFLNKSSIEELKEQGFEITNIELKGINKFDTKKSYVTTFNKNNLKELMNYYNLKPIEENKTVIKVKKSLPINKGNFESILLMILGIATIIICLYIVFKVLL